jgi:hypothetical protein
MPYTFELVFTGLCIFTFKGDKRTPTEVNALLVDGTGYPDPDKHKPLLSCNPANHHRLPKPIHRLVPMPDGTQIALHDLAGRVIEIDSLPTPRSITAHWRPLAAGPLGPHPQSNAEEQWLDWALALQRMNEDTPDPEDVTPYAGLNAGEVARVTLRQGELMARGFPKQPDGVSYALWDFKTATGPVHATHAMAGSIVLSIQGLPDGYPVQITHGASFQLHLAPVRHSDGSYETLMRASITNLPDLGMDPGAGPTPLSHFRYFYELVRFPRPVPNLNIPYPRVAVITRDNSYCPPTTHTKAE